MNKFLVIIFLGISLSSIVSAQTYFNKRATLHSLGAPIYGVLELNNGNYMTTSYCVDSINHLGGGWFLGVPGIRGTLWDPNGAIIADTFYQRQDKGSIAPIGNGIVQIEDGSIMIGALGGDTSGHAFIYITRWDTLGKLHWIKQYDKPYCYTVQLDGNSWGITDMKQDSSGNWIILSTYQCGIKYVTGYTNLMLSKFDSDFNVLWHHPLDDTFLDHSGGHIIINRDNYIVSGNVRTGQEVHKNFRY
ncbi:MAG: hypothetical protein JST36_06325, partial [Bacteroidetes bacterium]|nr:hypothetical protein [Bacteroidota bacterium]